MSIKKFSLKIIYRVLYYLGVFDFFYFLNRKKQIVVTYHNIISDHLFDSTLLHLGVSCSASAFSKQLDIILRRFKITTDIDLPKSCIISFDDGYKNNFEIAAPILNKKSVPGLFFVPACYFAEQTILWVDLLLMWISYVPIGTYEILGKEIIIQQNSQSRNSAWEFIYQQILNNYSKLKTLLEEVNNKYSFVALKKMINDDMYRLRFHGMNIEEIEKMKEMGHKLGCHSFKHDILSLLDEEELEKDFIKCNEHAKKYNSTFYSYPFGGKNEISTRVFEKCANFNYSAAFVNYNSNQSNKYERGRISLSNLQDKYFIEAKLCGFEFFFKKLLGKKD